MKVCFINPPFKAEYGKFSRESRSPSIGHSGVLYYPLWLIYAACVAEKNNFDVAFIDAPAKQMNKEQTIERVKKEGFDKSQFDMIKRSMYGEIVRGMNNPERAADYLAESYFENSDAFYEAQVLAEMTVEDCENAVREMFDPEKSSISVVDNK